MAVRVVEAERDGEVGFAGRLGFRRTRSGRRLWPDADKGRIVRESFAAGAVVNDVARHHGIAPQQLTHWRRQAREGRLVLVEEASFVPLEIDDTASPPEPVLMIQIAIGRVVVRTSASTPGTRIAEIAAALEARPWSFRPSICGSSWRHGLWISVAGMMHCKRRLRTMSVTD